MEETMKKPVMWLAPLLSLVALLVITVPAVGSSAVAMGTRKPGPRESTSSNWAGYAVENYTLVPQGHHQKKVITNNAVSSVNGTWLVPEVGPSPNYSGSTWSSCWVGIDGYSDSTVEQIGTEQDYNATTNTSSYSAWYEMYPAPFYTINETVSPGDVMTATVTWESGNTFTLTINDLGKWSFSTTQTLPSGSTALRQSAEAIAEAPSAINGVLPLADFGQVQFSGVTANGAAFDEATSPWSTIDPITMIDGTSQASPTSLTDSPNPDSFNVTWSEYSSPPHGHAHSK